MSIIDFLFRGFRPRKAKNNTFPSKPYKDKPYNVSRHATERMRDRNITKGQIHTNLHTKPIKVTAVKYDKMARPSYERYSDNKIATSINPKNKVVVTVRRFHTDEYNKIKRRNSKRSGKWY